ncbi:hypothetical protein [Geosporobacter ferrireducens]|uniref:Uncharacterized protein n=1 Tax=Geosporobacter ferrireducens TaxID=1424294 RepID=A0A1D8GCB4_9FIRM|nr:hypothetical protein [Geosporobacter ferrireducens]AOT68555.1 hypothetical protein Gferi_02460 [Geosporobacter ferrireducens]MTI54020.1 hypothetical protein [Geosporobacter ferrireducens]
MTIKKISSANRTRVYTMYVDRNTEVGKIDGVKPVNKISKISNKNFQSSDNTFLSTSSFYEQLRALKEQYHAYYQAERDLEETIETFKNEEHEDILTVIKSLIKKYNSAIASLQDFDHRFGTQHAKTVYSIVLLHKPQLYKIGITFDRNFHLFLNETVLIQSLKDHKNITNFLFDTKNGFISKIYRSFKEIKVPNKEKYSHPSIDLPSIINKKT